MSILIVTGKLAEKTIKGLVSDLEKDVDVLALPVTVASFITAKYAAHQLIKHDLSSYDMLIMPGSISGDLSLIEDAIGIPVYRGPIHAADLPLILSENIQLSKIQPANE
ncbi:MAG: DUF6513 domain-containing protein, partial [Candidatus Thorarchaeota archaeon]